MTLKKNRAPLLGNVKLCASFHCHMWIGVTVRKPLNGVMTFVTLTFDLWPWPFTWTSRLSRVIPLGNFRVIWWQEHCLTVWQTDGRTDRHTDGKKCSWSSLVAAKNKPHKDLLNGVYPVTEDRDEIYHNWDSSPIWFFGDSGIRGTFLYSFSIIQ